MSRLSGPLCLRKTPQLPHPLRTLLKHPHGARASVTNYWNPYLVRVSCHFANSLHIRAIFVENVYQDTHLIIASVTRSHLKGKDVIIITGASKAIGRAKAIACAETSAASIGAGARFIYLGQGENLRDATKNARK